MHAWSESNSMKFMCHLAFFWGMAMKKCKLMCFSLGKDRDVQIF